MFSHGIESMNKAHDPKLESFDIRFHRLPISSYIKGLGLNTLM